MADDQAQQQPQQPDAARLARDAAIQSAVSTLAYIAVSVLVSVAILKRDYLVRWWTRLTTRQVTPDEVRARRLTSELRQDLSRIEHGSSPQPRRRGLYEGETR